MKIQELREKPLVELRELESTWKRELWQARFDNFSNKLDNTSQIPKLKRNLARVKTLMREQLVAEKNQPKSNNP